MTAARKVQNAKTILLIDDEPEIRAYLMELLAQSYGDALFVTQADGGNSAVEILNNNKVDFIVCDFNMDDGNGLTVFAHLQKSKANARFVFFSASKDLEFLLPPLEGFFHGVVRKPNFEGIVEIVGKWLHE